MSDFHLNPHEARILGVLIEKEFTTPDQYPLSLNAATAGCNQKSNRDPVVDYLEDEVYVGLTGLCHKLLAGRASPAGSRVEKFRHNGRETLKLGDGALAVLAELLMRGPQTAGELRPRAGRMVPMKEQADLARHLDELVARGFAAHVAPLAGSRAGRIAQTLLPGLHALGQGADAPSAAPRPTPSSPGPTAAGDAPLAARVAALEGEVALLRRALEQLAGDLGGQT